MKINHVIKQLGFTIIELLLVIAIIGVMATIGVSLIQQRSSSQKVSKSALQIQQLLQAGMAYYTQNNKWPAYGTTGGKTEPPIPADFQPYVPLGETNNPWASTPNGYYFYQAPGTDKFDVVTIAPNIKTAQRIAAILPNAATGSTCPAAPDGQYKIGWPTNAICAEVTIPGQSTPSKTPIFGGAGTAADGQTATAHCPEGWTACFYTSCNLTTGKNFYNVHSISTGTDVKSCTVAKGATSCTATIQATTYLAMAVPGGATTAGTASYVVSCLPPNSTYTCDKS